MTRADLKHCGMIPDAREELNRSVREGRIESRYSIMSLEGMGSSSHDLGAELRMHSITVNCDMEITNFFDVHASKQHI